jgi:hypothetical protein
VVSRAVGLLNRPLGALGTPFCVSFVKNDDKYPESSPATHYGRRLA